MVEGTTYRFNLDADPNSAASIADTVLRILDANGVQLASNDQANSSNYSEITFTATATGTVYVSAQGYTTSTGAYSLSVAEYELPADDFAGDTTTTGVLTVGTASTGVIEVAGDQDWFAFDMVEGTTYRFNLDADPNSTAVIGDTVLRILDANGTELAYNDQANSSNYSEITFTATATGTFYVSAQGYSTATGAYSLSAVEVEPPAEPDPIDTSTATAVAIGDRVTATLDEAGEIDVYAIEVVAGQDYTIFLIRDTEDALQNPYLNLFDPNGEYITGSDDVATFDWNSRLDFTATETGTLYLSAMSSDGENSNLDDYITVDPTGGYTLLVEESDERADFTADEVANFLVNSFSPFAGAWDSNIITVDLNGLPEAAQTVARMALQAWADVTPLTFVEVAEGEVGNIVFVNTDQSGAYATSLGPGANNQVTINVAEGWAGGLAVDPVTGELDDDPFANVDSYTYQTYVHEIGHALGLGHGGAYNAGNGNPISYDYSRVYNQDSWDVSVMSYFSQQASGRGDGRYVLGPQIADILAVQSLYGVNTTTRDGDTVYGWNSTELGTVFDFAQFDSQPPAITLYDTGGTDTLDLSQYSGDQIIDLNAEQRSTIGGVNGSAALANVLNIARGTVIENATGGTGDDTITGNAVANILVGLDGDDVLNGGAGDDLLYGDAGDDVLTGGAGFDTAAYDSTAGPVRADLLWGSASSADGTDTLIGIEALRGSGFADVLSGDDANNQLVGFAGADRLTGRSGDDVLFGGDGADILFGDAGADSLDGGADNDRLFGGEGADTLFGGAGADILQGGTGDDELQGGADNDRLFGGDGVDRLFGGDGLDTLLGEAGNDVMDGGADNDRLYGQDGDDLLFGGDGLDLLVGGVGADALQGGAGGDRLFGGEDDDQLDGGAGDDLLTGGTGNDGLDGGEGNDRLYGEDGDDVLDGGAGSDRMIGGAGDDQLTGGDGADTLNGGIGADIIDGGDGQDRLFGEDGNDVLLGGLGLDTLLGGAGDDRLEGGEDADRLFGNDGVDALFGDGGADALYGGAGADRLDGGAGNDRLFGEDGDDVLDGGAGADRLYGGAGADVFVLSAGTDRIADFENDVDRIDVSSEFSSFAELQAAMSDGGGFVSIASADGTLRVDGVALADLDAGDFIFGGSANSAQPFVDAAFGSDFAPGPAPKSEAPALDLVAATVDHSGLFAELVMVEDALI